MDSKLRLIPIVFLLLALASSSYAVWFNTSYSYTQNYTINSNVSITLTDYRSRIDINTSALIAAGKMRADCYDLLIVAADDSIAYPHVIVNATCNTVKTVVFFNIPSLPTGDQTVKIYYGAPTATNHQDGAGAHKKYLGAYYLTGDGVDYTGINTLTQTGGTVSFITNSTACRYGICASFPNVSTYLVKTTATGLNTGTTGLRMSSWQYREGYATAGATVGYGNIGSFGAKFSYFCTPNLIGDNHGGGGSLTNGCKAGTSFWAYGISNSSSFRVGNETNSASSGNPAATNTGGLAIGYRPTIDVDGWGGTTPAYISEVLITNGTGNEAGVLWMQAEREQYSAKTGAEVQNTAPPTVNNIVWVSQTPANLTTTNVIVSNLKIQYNITNITSGTPYLSYKTNNSLSDISLFINGTAYGGWKNKTGTNVSSLFNFTLDDNKVMPGTYALNFSLFENTAHSSTSISSNNYLSTEILNVSNQTAYNFYEVMATGTGTNNINAYYCNSTYAFNQAPGANSNCALIGNIPNNATYDHTHSANSAHHYLPFSINITSGTFGSTGIKITAQSFFILRGATAVGTNVYTIANQARASTTKLSTNSGNSFTPLTYSVDTHIHQFTADETIYYQAFATVAGVANYSTVFSQVFGLTNLPPTTPTILTPTAGNQYGTINITWLASQNLTPSIIYYNISLLNPNFTFNKTIIGNTSNTSYLWNSIGTTQGNYTIQVKAIDNFNLSSSDFSEEFTLATFVITASLPTDGVILQGNNTLFTYSVNNIIINATCAVVIDTFAYDSRTVFNQAISYNAPISTGSHSWYVSCTSNDALYTTTSTTRTFSMNFSSFLFSTNLTTAPANVYNQPQALFYDKNGSLNVLYYTDEPAGATVWIKTIYQNSTIATYNLTYPKTNSFYSVFRDTNGTLILTFNVNNSAIMFKTSGTALTVLPTIFPHTNVMNNTRYDSYTYANTNQYETLSLTNSSYFFFMVPLTNGTGYFKKYNNNATIEQVGNQLTNGITATWQTLANNSQLTEWYYLTTGSTNISLGYYNGTRNIITILDSSYTGAEINGSIGNFYEYGGKKYVMLSNLTRTTIHDITNNQTYQFTETLTAPSFIFFVDKDTFLFFNTVGATTNAYSCYFATSPNCTKFNAAEYGISMPYLRGTLTTMKRAGTSDVVAQGIISSGDVVKLLYSQYTYDGKYVCYDEMAETRDTFRVGIFTDTTAHVLSNSSYGYVIPSSILGTGTKKALFTCQNGTQRLFIAGLNGNYTINSYSLAIPKGVYYTFQALDQYSIPIQGATLSAYRFSVANQAFVIIEQGISDFNGNAIFYLEPFQFYKFVVSANGFVVLSFDLTPGSTTTLPFKLSTSGGTILVIPTFERVFNDVSYSLLPLTSYQNATFNITYTITSASAGLQYYGMQVQRNFNGTTTTVFNTNTTGASGGILQYTATLNGTYLVNTWFKHQNYTEYTPPQTSYFLSAKQGLSYVKDRLPGIFGGWAYFLIATVVSLIVAGFISRFTIDGAGVVGLLVLWFFTVMNPTAVIFGGITIVMATILTTLIVGAGLVWKQFG